MPRQSTEQRPLPSDIEAEQAVLAACFINPKIIPQVQGILSGPDFSRTSHQIIFRGICELKESLDAVTFKDWCSRNNVDHAPYVTTLLDVVSSSAGWKIHAEIVKGLAQRRKLIQACQGISDSCHDLAIPISEVEQQLRDTFNHLHAVPRYRIGVDFENIFTPERMYEEYETYVKKLKENRFITGIDEIDKRIRGVGGGEVLFIIARAGTYKTALLQNLLRRYIHNSSWGAAFFSLEMPIANIAERYLQITHEMKGYEIEKESQHDSVDLKTKFIRSLSRLFVVPTIVSINEIQKYIEMIEGKLETKIGVIGIDYLGLMEGEGKGEYEIVSNLAKDIKSLAKNLNIPVIAISQTSRKGGTGETEISLDMSRGSGVIEEAADFLLGIFKQEDKVICKILKNRKGRVGSCWEIQLDPQTFILGTECREWFPPVEEKPSGYSKPKSKKEYSNG